MGPYNQIKKEAEVPLLFRALCVLVLNDLEKMNGTK